MSLDDHIYNLRREKLKQIEALGQATYRSKYEFTHSVEQILATYSAKSGEELEKERVNVRVAGRIMAIRLMGKAGFAHLQQDGKRLQIYVKKDAVGEKSFELYKLLDLGDHIGVSGYLFRTRTGELSVHVEEITFLSKDLLPLPEKWHGLTDVELRYRQRYVDLVMNPEVREVFLKRTKMVQSMRRTMDAHGFIEVETPMMQPIAGGAVARPFVTHHNTLDMDLFLRIAPELYLKRLVVGGLDRVYEINRNFRNEGLGWRWNPEFTMLEAYQAYTDYQGIMNLTQEVITEAAKAVSGGTKTKWGEHEIDWANWHRMTMREAIIHYWPEASSPKPVMNEFASREGVDEIGRSDSMPGMRTWHTTRKNPWGRRLPVCLKRSPKNISPSPPSFTNSRPRSRRFPSRSRMNRSGPSVSKFLPGRWNFPTASANSTIPRISGGDSRRS